MNKRFAFSVTVAVTALLFVSVAGTAFGQVPTYDPSARAIFTTLPPHNNFPGNSAPAGAQLQQWTFNWTSSFDNRNFSSVIAGTDPSTNNSTTTVTVAVFPIKMVYGASNGNMTFDPASPYSGKYSTTQMVLDSPIFQSYFDYRQGGTDLGRTQYIDAYQRGNFAGAVKTNTNYHIILKTVLGPEQTFNVPSGEGSVIANPWSGIPTGTADINWFDSQLQTVLSKFPQVQPNILPLFITSNVYLTEGVCCVGGYHSANGFQPSGQTYSYSTVIAQDNALQDGVFSQDISALSHEIGEWLMDPFVDNPSPCPSNSILEIGDPLEHNATFGDYPYTIQGFTFHPQDLVFITWFGAPAATSLDRWDGKKTDVISFQNENLAVCQVN